MTTDQLRVDALLHFLQANCFNSELNADESRNILFNIDQLREWRSGKHDDYVENIYGRLHSMGGCEQGQGASAGSSGGGPTSVGDSSAIATHPEITAHCGDMAAWLATVRVSQDGWAEVLERVTRDLSDLAAAMDSGKIISHISDYRQRVLQDKQK